MHIETIRQTLENAGMWDVNPAIPCKKSVKQHLYRACLCHGTRSAAHNANQPA